MKIVRNRAGQFATGTSRHDLPVFERYAVDPETGCWMWLGNIMNKGYGRCKIGDKNVGAHRAFYTHFVGEIPAGKDLDHLCRTRSCVNPAHLEPVTRAENTRRGSSAKLTADDVREIRAAVDEICARFGIRPRTLSAIGERQIWKDV